MDLTGGVIPWWQKRGGGGFRSSDRTAWKGKPWFIGRFRSTVVGNLTVGEISSRSVPPFKLAGVFLIKFLTRLNCREIFCYLFSISFFFFFVEKYFAAIFIFVFFFFFSFLFGNDFIWFRVIRSYININIIILLLDMLILMPKRLSLN